MRASLITRFKRLEARRPAVADPPYTPPEPPPGWCEEVFRLLRDYGYLDDTLRSWGLTETDIAAIYTSIVSAQTVSVRSSSAPLASSTRCTRLGKTSRKKPLI